ncbi:MAG: zinc ribbon domain-containing protein, partial [Lachnospiraceae bacterium]|nr:zinc ribbon domain-containing protein [Lachnospiraceae bacterium]
GVLINHSFEIRNGKKIPITEERQIRHEGYLPVIIEKEEWETIQHMLNMTVKTTYGNRAVHRYVRFLNCGDCGNKFVSINRHTREGTRVEYICKSYQSYGNETCSSHRIREERLDDEVRQHIHVAYHQLKIEQEETMEVKRLWELNRRAIESRIKRLQMEVQLWEGEVDELLMEKIRWQKNSQE